AKVSPAVRRALRAAKPLKFLWLVLQSYGHRGRIELSPLVPRRHRQPHFIRASYLPQVRCEPPGPTTTRAVPWQFFYPPHLPVRHVLPQTDYPRPADAEGGARLICREASPLTTKGEAVPGSMSALAHPQACLAPRR